MSFPMFQYCEDTSDKTMMSQASDNSSNYLDQSATEAPNPYDDVILGLNID